MTRVIRSLSKANLGASLRPAQILALLSLFAWRVFSQTDRGAITGTISDPAAAVVASAANVAQNSGTGAIYRTESTTTGNYTLAELSAGVYELSVTVPGFKQYVRRGITVQVAQTVRIDIGLEVGATSESVTVSSDAPLLKTETGELSHNVESRRLDDLPILGIGAASAGSQGVRNPLAVTQLAPGTFYQPNSTVRVNGAPANSQSIRIEGQDAGNGFLPYAQAETQPSVDAIQELSIQTSNYAAEFGQVGGGVFNFTTKSGSNQYHGTAYDYFVNEVFNAGQPFTNDGHGDLLRPRQRRNDYGFTLGGPVSIPRVYDGHDKTFFFFNFEQFRETQNINNQFLTVPTVPFRNGDFSSVLTGRTLGVDPLGRPILENTIYDPSTERVANGQTVRDAFPGNRIPTSLFDPVAAKVQSLIPLPATGGAINNLILPYPSQRVTTIPAFKIDHSLTSKAKLSFYYSHNATGSQFSPTLGQSDGLPLPITAARGTFIESHIERLNFDYTLTPTLLLHVGAGYQHNDFKDTAPVTDYNALQQLGLRGTTLNRNFPCFQGLNASLGGVQNLGPCAGQSRSLFIKPTFNTSFTWVKNDHSYKAGAEFRTEGYPAQIFTNTYGNFQFSAAQTGLPSAALQGLQGSTVGYPYASFLLGLVNTATIAAPANPRIGKHQLGLFIQDTWKVTRRFTLDYGLRWDYSTYLQEQYGRFASFSPTTADPSAGGHPGAPVFEGSGPGHCNCNFSSNYPFAFGPRLGAAYQITRKTVLRAGFGIVYDGTSNGNGSAGLAASNVAINAPFPTSPAAVLAQGIPASPLWPNFNPGQYPFLAGAANNLLVLDRNAGRPARQYTWSIGVQHELATNLLVEASYVGSRGVWWQANNLTDINALTSDILGSYGLSLNSASDRQLLISPVNSAAAVARGFNNPPYAGFPSTATVAQSLRPFPQFGSIGNLWAPLGKTWYDSLQAKVTKRLSHGLDFTYTFTWQKSLTLGAENEIAGALGVQPTVNDVFNRSLNKNISGYDQPFYGVLALNYTLPILKTNKALSRIVRDWTIAPLIQDASGLPIHVPYAQNQLNSVLLRASNNNAFGITPTFANRVPNVPLFSQDLNCHCFDPNRAFALNPAAWTDPAPGQFGTSAAYYGDYRYQRRPVENLAVGRIFRFTETIRLNLRIEFTNIFNRTEVANPTATNALATQVRTQTGQTESGFGFINTATTFSPPRQGSIVARFQF